MKNYRIQVTFSFDISAANSKEAEATAREIIENSIGFAIDERHEILPETKQGYYKMNILEQVERKSNQKLADMPVSYVDLKEIKKEF
jgi:transcriptional regulator of NAD metabolism